MAHWDILLEKPFNPLTGIAGGGEEGHCAVSRPQRRVVPGKFLFTRQRQAHEICG